MHVLKYTCCWRRATKEKQRAEVAAAELRGKGDAEVEALRGAVAAAEQRTAEVHSSVERVANELRDYKARGGSGT